MAKVSSGSQDNAPQQVPVRTVHVTSLGCPKNRVDSELMIGQLQAAGLQLVAAPEDADILLVNTCAFIDESKKESIDAILDLAEYKAAKPGTRLVVAGCLAQRHADELRKSLPEVDAFVGTGEYDHLPARLGLPGSDPDGLWQNALQLGRKGRPEYIADHLEPRYVGPNVYSSYLKIAEGCDQACSFCIIPKLRGKQRSRTVQDCVAEAEQLVKAGVLELNLIAQDLTHYGVDIGQPDALSTLVRALGRVEGLRWVRLMYAYPHNFSDSLIAAMAETENCCKYLDMPLQHAADPVLRAMKRLSNRREIETLLAKLRAAMPDLVLRTTMLVGHPGETAADFQQLLEFVQEQQFDRLGAFAFSREDGTLSGRMAGQLHSATKKSRLAQLMKLQEGISTARLQAQVGRDLDVLIEGLSDETDLLLQGRSRGQAPEIDGLVYINDAPDNVGRGQIRRVRITDSHTHDWVGHVID